MATRKETVAALILRVCSARVSLVWSCSWLLLKAPEVARGELHKVVRVQAPPSARKYLVSSQVFSCLKPGM
jgi:hypothetical protein